MSLIASGGEIGQTFSAVVARVKRDIDLAGTTFASRCRVRLSPAEFNQLLDQGYCFHKCPNNRDPLFTFRAQELSPAYLQMNLDVFDLQAKQLVAITDFEVFPTAEKTRMYGLVIMPQAGFTEGAQRVLLEAGFTAEELIPHAFSVQRWYRIEGQTGEVPYAAWVKDGYRQKDKSGYGDIFGTLMGAVAQISKGLGSRLIRLEKIGGEDAEDAHREGLMAYYEKTFGAEVEGHPFFGNMVINI